jgi:hypothetical protein
MKKNILFLTALTAFCFTSCKKDRSCTCTTSSPTVHTVVVDWQTSPTTTSTSTVGGGENSDITIYNKVKKSDAKKACISSGYENTTTTTNSGTTYNPASGNFESFNSTTTDKTTSGTTCTLK